MPTISSILSNATTGLRAQQAALNVTAHNISNAATEGYARQKPVFGTNPALRTPEGAFGTGVSVTNVAQIRDRLIEANFRTESGDASQYQSRSDLLSRIETVLGEPGDYALSGSLDQFLSAWSDLATNPNNSSTRTVVRQRGQEMVDKLHELATNLTSVSDEVRDRLTTGVSRVNALTDEITRLNQEIVSIEADGITAGDLRDARARALDELATLLPVAVVDQDNGSVSVTTSGIGIVDGAHATTLKFDDSGATAGLAIVGRAGILPETGGSLGGLLEVYNDDLPMTRTSLDDFARELAVAVNAIHQTGTNPTGATGLDFFWPGDAGDPTTINAWTIRLSDDVAAAADAVAAGTPDGVGDYRAGANDVALAIAGLRNSDVGTLGTTPGAHIQGLVSKIGLAVRSSSDAAEVHQTLADQADARRASVSGVSVDEELVQMIQFQSAYAAAAKMVTAADEMMQTLLRI